MLLATYFTKNLSKYDRQRICMILLCFNTIQILFAIYGFFVGAYVSLNINSKAHLVKGYSLKPIGGTISGCSIALFLMHCLGAKASNDCCYLRTRHRFENKLLLIVLGYIVMATALLAISVFSAIQYFKLKQVLHVGLLHAMRFYSKHKTMKREFDEIQIDYKCCGSSNYTDWFKIKWMPENSLPPENDRVFSRRDYIHSVPFSCCDPSNAAPCFHRLVDVQRGEYRGPSSHGFYKKGCTDALLSVLEETTKATAILALLPFFMELAIIAETRYLQTSLEDCKQQGNLDGIGRCWLFKKYSHEPQFQHYDMLRQGISESLCSSEESVVYEPRPIKYRKTVDDSPKQLQTDLKIETNDESRALPAENASESDDLRTLLVKCADKSDENGRSGRKFRKRHPEKAGKGQGSKHKKNIQEKRSSNRRASNVERETSKDDSHERNNRISSDHRIQEMKFESNSLCGSHVNEDLPVVGKRKRKITL